MGAEEIRERTQGVWDRFYSLSSIWQRSTCVKSFKSRLAFVLISKLYRQMYANTGIATDSARVSRSARWARLIAKHTRRLFVSPPMPELMAPEKTAPRRAARGHGQSHYRADGLRPVAHQPRTFANTSGATIVASDSMMNLGVSTPSLPQVIFSLGTAPE